MAHLQTLLWRWCPVLLWTTGIFFFSSRSEPLDFLNALQPVSPAIEQPGQPAATAQPPSENYSSQVGRWLHFAEYAGLMLLLTRALMPEQPFDRRALLRGLVAGLIIALSIAVADELYQELTPQRGFELGDVAYDAAGMLSAALVRSAAQSIGKTGGSTGSLD